MGIQSAKRFGALFGISGREEQVQSLALGSCGEEFVDETAAEGEAESAVRWIVAFGQLSSVAVCSILRAWGFRNYLPVGSRD